MTRIAEAELVQRKRTTVEATADTHALNNARYGFDQNPADSLSLRYVDIPHPVTSSQ